MELYPIIKSTHIQIVSTTICRDIIKKYITQVLRFDAMDDIKSENNNKGNYPKNTLYHQGNIINNYKI